MRYIIIILLFASCNPVKIALNNHYPEVRDSVIARGDCKIDTITTVEYINDTLVINDTIVDTLNTVDTLVKSDTIYKKAKVITKVVRDLSSEDYYKKIIIDKDSLIVQKDSLIAAQKHEMDLVYQGAEKNGMQWKIFLFTTLSSIALLLRSLTRKK